MKDVKTAAVIAEYNPFHNGHAWQLRQIRERSGADQIIVLMSGDFVQRGEPAIADKYTRTRMALLGGANLVLELPLAAATGSAGEFAAGAAAILDKLGAVDELWFGSEIGDARPLEMIAEILVQEPEVFKETVKEALSKGRSYPAAQEEAILISLEADTELAKSFIKAALEAVSKEKGCPAEIISQKESSSISQFLHQILSTPNNQLGISYIAALKRKNSRIRIRTLERKGAAYHSMEAAQNFSSAEGIRNALYKGDPEIIHPYWNTMPDFTKELLGLTMADGGSSEGREGEIGTGKLRIPSYVRADDFSEALFLKLLQEDDFEQYAGISEDLGNRIRKMRYRCRTFSSFAELLKSRNMTRTRINRALLHILLNVKKEDTKRIENPTAVRILGMRDAEPIFHRIGDSAANQIVLTASAAKMPEESCRSEINASDLYEWVRSWKSGERICPEYSRMPVKI